MVCDRLDALHLLSQLYYNRQQSYYVHNNFIVNSNTHNSKYYLCLYDSLKDNSLLLFLVKKQFQKIP